MATRPAVPVSGQTADYIRIESLSKSFAGAPALRSLGLSVAEGEFLVLLGPSGCGKTTTMRCLVGLESADAGSITVDGRVLFDAATGVEVPPNKRNMGMVFQSYALWPHKSVFHNVAFPLQMQRVARPAIARAVGSMLATVGLGGYEKRSISTLSGGQMQRVALARSLVMNPKILLLDEPLSNLDSKLRIHLRHELKEIQQRIGVTTLYVTHDQDEALGLADRIVVMRDGVIAQQGTPEDLFRRPSSPYVADFLGMSNQFPATVTSASGGRVSAAFERGPAKVTAVDGRTDATSAAGRLCMRPEAIRLVSEGDSSDSDAVNRWPATVLSSQYQGSRRRYHVTLDNGPELFADAEAIGAGVGAGDRCAVAVEPDDVLFLIDSPDPS